MQPQNAVIGMHDNGRSEAARLAHARTRARFIRAVTVRQE